MHIFFIIFRYLIIYGFDDDKTIQCTLWYNYSNFIVNVVVLILLVRINHYTTQPKIKERRER